MNTRDSVDRIFHDQVDKTDDALPTAGGRTSGHEKGSNMVNEKFRQATSRGACAAALGVLGFLAGCASVPDVAVSYRPVKWAMLVTVVHTVTCNRDSNLALVERGATFLPIYSAAPSDDRFQLRLKDLDRFYADSDIALSLTDDGRLKSINASTTGQGEAVVKAAITAAATLAAAPVAAAAPAAGVSLFSHNVFQRRLDQLKPATVCEVVRKRSLSAPDQLPQVSLIQIALIKPDVGANQLASPSADQQPLLEELKGAGLDFSATVFASFAGNELQPIVQPKAAVASDEVPLTLQRMVMFSAAVKDAQGDIGAKSMPAPSKEVFVLPVPKAALFGKQSFSLVLADSGRISSIGYGRTAGLPGALGALTAVAGAETTEDNVQAAAMKAAADLIAQQQRYNNCKLKPAECK